MIAQALACDPKLLIADEPTTALDVTVQAEILKLMRDLRSRIDSGIVLITHDMGVVADMADTMIVMKDGKVVEQGEARQLFANPQHPYTIKLLDAVPHLGPQRRGSGRGAVRDERDRRSRTPRRSPRRTARSSSRPSRWSSSTRAAVARPPSARSTAWT